MDDNEFLLGTTSELSLLVGATIISVSNGAGGSHIVLSDGRGIDVIQFADRKVRLMLLDRDVINQRRAFALQTVVRVAAEQGYAIRVTADLRRGETPPDERVVEWPTRAMTLEATT